VSQVVLDSTNANLRGGAAYDYHLPIMSTTDSNELTHHLTFPLPYRIFFLTGLGILGWAINLQSFDVFDIDPISAMDLHSDTKTIMPAHHSSVSNRAKVLALYTSVYRISISFFTLCFLSWALYRLATRGDTSLVDSYGYIPSITAVVILLILICPYNVFLKCEREKFT
jgi:hypothetical protein